MMQIGDDIHSINLKLQISRAGAMPVDILQLFPPINNCDNIFS